MNNEKTLDEKYDEYAEFLRNDPEEQEFQQVKKEDVLNVREND